MLFDFVVIVRCVVLEIFCDILFLVREFFLSDVKIFFEYIFFMFFILFDDLEESVRICYVSNIFKFVLIFYGFLIYFIGMSEAGVLDGKIFKINSNL